MNENVKKISIILLALAGCALIVHLIFGGSALDEYKKTADASLDPETEQFVNTVLQHIEKDDMKSLFKLMFSSDYGLFSSNYVKGLFAQKDFMPAKLTGRVRTVSKSSTKNIMIEVRSEKRNTLYWISLVEYQGKWKVAAISDFKLP